MTYSFRTNGNYIDFVHTDNTSLQVESVLRSLHNTSRAVTWSLPEDTTRINFTVDDIRVEGFPITEIDFDGTAINSQDDFETGIEAMFPGLAGSGEVGGVLLSETVEITDAQFKALDSTPIQIIPAPGAGKAIIVINWVLSVNFSAGAYAGTGATTNGLQPYYDSPSGNAVIQQIQVDSTAPIPQILTRQEAAIGRQETTSDANNAGIELWSALSNPLTGGDAANTLKVTVYYVVVDL